MRLVYPLTVSAVDVRRQHSYATHSAVRLNCLSLASFADADVRPGSVTHDASRVYVSQQCLELQWPHHLYVLVAKQDEAVNLQYLHWLTVHALHLHRLCRMRDSTDQRRRQQQQAARTGGGCSQELRGVDHQQHSDDSTADATTDAAASHAASSPSGTSAPQRDRRWSVEYELVLYDVGTALTSPYDCISELDESWTRLDKPASATDPSARTASSRAAAAPQSAASPSPATRNTAITALTRQNNLYRLRVQTMAELRFLVEHFRDNAHYWSRRFSVPVNLLSDHWRFALDVYVTNLRFQISRQQLAASGLLDSTVSDHGSGDMYRRLLHKWKGSLHEATAALRFDQLDLRRWFACGHWCLLDEKVISVVPPEEFAHCARTMLGLDAQLAPDALLQRMFDAPLSFIPRVVWDIETIARGKGTIPRGVAADQRLSSVVVVYERPALDRGRVVVIWVLAPEHMSADEIGALQVLGDAARNDDRLQVAHVRLHVYRDERALLLDFLADMFLNLSLLTEFMGLAPSPTTLARYADLASLLVGYNSIEYDYQFLLDRCLFFGTRDFAPAILALRRFASPARPLCHAYVFNEAQICLDEMQLLMARNRQLKSYKLASVLKVYGCDIDKLDFSAVEIRGLYYADPPRPPADAMAFMRDVLRYNVFDCLSLCSLLNRSSFAQHMTVMMDYFFAELDKVMYKGNSSLLPTLIQLDSMRDKREMAVVRQPQRNNFLCAASRVEPAVFTDNQRLLQSRYNLVLCLEAVPRGVELTATANPFNALLVYHRLMMMRVCTPADTTLAMPDIADLFSGQAVLCPANEMEMLRVGEKTYIGGMNYADAGHSKYPILMDYNSFYPSIIRSYVLDVCKVAVLDLKQLFLTLPVPLIECLLATKNLRLFDYTSPEDVAYTVDLAAHRRLVGSEWHEAVEYTTLEQLVRTTRYLGRRFLALVYSPAPSTIDTIVTKALERRAVFKRRKRENPGDVVVQFMEMMEKLLANSLYGYMNFAQSAIFSRATAAAVTLLCRNAFCRTRRIIESRELMATTALDPDLYRFRVIYIDTDGCIFVLTRRHRNDRSVALPPHHAPPHVPWFQLYVDLPPADTVAVYDRLTDTVNRLLNLPHVLLAAEHYDASAVCVFATKKYVLLKGVEGQVKRTGFESNAAQPIRDMYELVLRNALCAFHTYRLVEFQRFVVRIRHHRLFFFAIFDYLYASWLDTVTPDGSKRYTLQHFGINRPLNPKDTKGEMSSFIDRVLYEFQYAAGERVWILKIVDPDTAVQSGTLYSARGRFVLLEELEASGLADVIPNFKFYLGGYARYLYQCIEGHQTLRQSVRETREPIEAGYYLDSFQSIFSYSWGAWLFRTLRARGVSATSLYWPDTEPTSSAMKQARQTTLDGMGSMSAMKLPKLLTRKQLDAALADVGDTMFARTLFTDYSAAAAATRSDYDAKQALLRTDKYVCVDQLLDE